MRVVKLFLLALFVGSAYACSDEKPTEVNVVINGPECRQTHLPRNKPRHCVDTLRRNDTIFITRVKIDTIRLRDTILRVDTVRLTKVDTIRLTKVDTVVRTRVDTIRLTKVDTLWRTRVDTIVKRDTIIRPDTIWVTRTVVRVDTLWRDRIVQRVDTIWRVRTDTVFVWCQDGPDKNKGKGNDCKKP